MLQHITLDGFRSFADTTTIEFAPLTILAGSNNVGKSSVIQILLAFVQSEEARSGGSLLLNGAWCDLGPFEQVVTASRSAADRSFSVAVRGYRAEARSDISDPSLDVLWRFGPSSDGDGLSASIHGLEYCCADVSGKLTATNGSDRFEWHEEDENQRQFDGDAIMLHPGFITSADNSVFRTALAKYTGGFGANLLPFQSALVHAVGPYRMPPQAVYASRISRFGPPIGRYAEHTAELLWRSRTQLCDLIIPGSTSTPPDSRKPVQSALNDWWSYIFDGTLALQINVPARLGYTLAIDTPSADSLGLGQVGIGLSQALPIVATAVVSKPGDLVMIDTPEAHLHPSAQHRLANLLIELVRRGRQVIVETHSEHIVNSVRLAVKNGFSRDDQVIQFFAQHEGRTAVEKVPLDNRGKALRWPPGFFDQATIDLAELIR